MGFLLEPIWPLGDIRWGYLAAICLAIFILTYMPFPHFPRLRLHTGSPWVKWWFWLRHPLNTEKRADAELLYGYNLEDEDD